MKRLKSVTASANDESIVSPLIDELKDKFDYIISGLEILEIDGKDNEAVDVASSLLIEIEKAQSDIADLQAQGE
jgi:hypothetical protein|nr:MAG TPA: hypothetical protein [Caudoviricetes sp.]